MRKITIALCLVFMAGFAVGQDDIYYQPENRSQLNLTLNTKDSIQILKYQIDHVRYCLLRSSKQRSSGYALQIIGSGLIAVSTDMEGSNKKNLLIGGGVMSLIGLIMVIDSEKWMKRAYIGPDGLGVVYKF